MKKQIRDQWADALESGEYEQATGALVLDGAYCCLGVLCELAIKDGVEDIRRVEDQFQITSDEYPGEWLDHDDGDLPEPVMKWAGLTDSNPVMSPAISPDTPPFRAINLNDDEHWTFKQIAEAVRQLPGE